MFTFYVLYRLHLLSITFDVNLLYSYPSPLWLFLVRRRPVLPLRLLWAGENTDEFAKKGDEFAERE